MNALADIILKHATSSGSEETFDVLVGPEEERYTVHKTKLCEDSDFFRVACNGTWKEGCEGVIKLPEVLPSALETYPLWKYTERVDMVDYDTHGQSTYLKYEDIKGDEAVEDILGRLIHAFALGDVLMDITFKNAVVDEFVAFCKFLKIIPKPESAELLLETVPLKSTLTLAFVDLILVHVREEWFEERAHTYPAAFILEVAKAAVRDRWTRLDERGPINAPRCEYQEHKEGKGETRLCNRGKWAIWNPADDWQGRASCKRGGGFGLV